MKGSLTSKLMFFNPQVLELLKDYFGDPREPVSCHNRCHCVVQIKLCGSQARLVCSTPLPPHPPSARLL